VALLNISEPGQSKPKAHSVRKRALGIDLGTTNSLVAVASEGQAHTLCDHEGHCLVPSVVHYGANGEVTVGDDAIAGGAEDSANTISSVKRLMGRGVEDIDYELPYQISADADGGMPLIGTAAGDKSPVEVSAEILRVLAQRGRRNWTRKLKGQ